MKLALPSIIATFWLLALASSPAGEWQNLCNGKDLTGWTSEPDHKHWSIQDGVINGKSDARKKGSLLWSDENPASAFSKRTSGGAASSTPASSSSPRTNM